MTVSVQESNVSVSANSSTFAYSTINAKITSISKYGVATVTFSDIINVRNDYS